MSPCPPTNQSLQQSSAYVYKDEFILIMLFLNGLAKIKAFIIVTFSI